ncbi:MAG: hypothetical protein ACR2O6_10220 [Ilumatobacteraceae bacterium]
MLAAPRRAAPFLLVASALLVSILAVGLRGGEPPTVEALAGTSRYAPIDAAIRVVDTRPPGSPIGPLAAGDEFVVAPVTAAVAAAAGVAAGDVVAVVANVTLDQADGEGFVTVYPDGEGRPIASSVNTDGPGQTVPNMVTARLGTGGRIKVYASMGTQVLIDVQGVYVTSSSSTEGRLVVLDPYRAMDTRGTGPVPAGGAVTVDLTSGGLPATASAAVLNVTAVLPSATGWLTVWDGDGSPPNASNVNYVVGSIVANQVIAGVDAGKVDVFSSAGTDVLVDLVGYMTGPSAPSDDAGLFVALSPGRLVDTRSQDGSAPGVPLTSGYPITGQRTLSTSAFGKVGIPTTGLAAINTNITMTGTAGTGFLTAWGDGDLPGISSLNTVGANRTRANHVITDISGSGCVNLYSWATTHAIVDVTGYYTGDDSAPALDLCDQAPAPPQPGATPSTGPHCWLFTLADDECPPAPTDLAGRWDPCRLDQEIKYAVNPLLATQAHIDQMYFAIRQMEIHTGFDFVPYSAYPTTTEGLDDRRAPTGANFLIGFSNPANTPGLAGSVVGIGGGFWFPTVGNITAGYVLIDTPALGTGNSLRSALVHEFGHAMGQGHVPRATSPDEIMEPVLNSSITTPQSGDAQGLWRLGTAQSCIGASLLRGDPGPIVRVEEAHLEFARQGDVRNRK